MSHGTAGVDGLPCAIAVAESYGDQTERDHDDLVRAIKAGRVEAQQDE